MKISIQLTILFSFIAFSFFCNCQDSNKDNAPKSSSSEQTKSSQVISTITKKIDNTSSQPQQMDQFFKDNGKNVREDKQPKKNESPNIVQAKDKLNQSVLSFFNSFVQAPSIVDQKALPAQSTLPSDKKDITVDKSISTVDKNAPLPKPADELKRTEQNQIITQPKPKEEVKNQNNTLITKNTPTVKPEIRKDNTKSSPKTYLPSAKTNKFQVQVGSFSSRDQALNRISMIKSILGNNTGNMFTVSKRNRGYTVISRPTENKTANSIRQQIVNAGIESNPLLIPIR